jgi:hypothetical protein
MPEPVAHADEGKAPAAPANPQPAPAFDDDPVSNSLEAARRAEELQRQQAAAQPPQLSPWKQDFLAAYPELTADEEAASLTRYHYLAALRRGIRDDSPEMNEAILSGFKRMLGAVDNASREPEREAPPVNAPEPPRKSVPYSAPVTRGAPSVAGGTVAQRIVLSPEEVDMAHRSYRDLPKAQAERLYWEMKTKMLTARRNGTLNE